MAIRPKFAVSATPLWAASGARRSRAELPLLPKETWPSSPNGGVKFPAGFRTIAPAVAVVRLPNCNRHLPFESDSLAPIESSAGKRRSLSRRRLPRRQSGSRAHRNERFEISIPNAGDGRSRRPFTAGRSASSTCPDWIACPLVFRGFAPGAPQGGAVDAGLLLFSYGGMLALFTVLGGHIGFNKLD